MFAVFGDLHGDVETLERFVYFLLENPFARDITHAFFTGDFFGLQPDQECDDILGERERQYKAIEGLLRHFPVGLFAVPGNYDSFFISYFKLYDLHHKSLNIHEKKIFGHGGSHHVPTDIAERAEIMGHIFDRNQFAFQNKDNFSFLLDEDPDIILSHSPIKPYIQHCLTDPEFSRDLIYLAGHDHKARLSQIVPAQESRGRVYLIRPGALGRTVNLDTGEILPQTFLLFSPYVTSQCKAFTLREGHFFSETLPLSQRDLDDYMIPWESR